MSPSRLFTPSRLSILALLASACATQGPTDSDEAQARRFANPAAFDAAGEFFWRAVRDHDDAGTSRDLANHLKRPDAREAFASAMQMFRWENGRLNSWHLTARATAGDEEHRQYELQCSRGVVRAVLTFHRKTGHITNLQIVRTSVYVAAPVPGIDSAVSWTETTVGPGLGATIASPRAAATGGKLSAVVLIGESGRLDRDESTGPVRPFRDLGDGLASRGVVTIRFDKRSFVSPHAFGRVFTIDEDLIQDGASAVAVIRRQPSVDPSRVFIVGHGLGGLAAVASARRAGDIAGLVLVGVPARPLLYVTLERLRDREPDDDVMTQATVDAQSIIDGTAPRDAQILGAPAAFWYDLAKRDTFEELRALRRPVLLLRGETDTYATAIDQQRWLQELAGVPVRAEGIPLVDHFLMTPMTRNLAPSEAEAGAGPRVPEYLLDMVADFVAKAPDRTTRRAR